MMHTNSLAAYAMLQQSGGKLTRRLQILELMLDGLSRTDRHIMKELGYSDTNDVRPRITELVKEGVLEEICHIRDDNTGVKVRVTRIKQQQTSLI